MRLLPAVVFLALGTATAVAHADSIEYKLAGGNSFDIISAVPATTLGPTACQLSFFGSRDCRIVFTGTELRLVLTLDGSYVSFDTSSGLRPDSFDVGATTLLNAGQRDASTLTVTAIPTAVTPEPSQFLLSGTGLIALLGTGYRRLCGTASRYGAA